MTRLSWGDLPPIYDMGVDRGVLYLDGTAHPWNGLVSVDEKEVGSIDVEHYFDGNRIHISSETAEFEGVVTAYTYPDAFAEYNGYSDRDIYKRFGFSYRTQRGSSYQIHIVYDTLVLNDSWGWQTLTNRADPSLFAWNIHGRSVPVPGASPSSKLILETPADSNMLGPLEDILYGTDLMEPRLPSPEELVEFYELAAMLRVVYNGDGTYTVSGPDDMVRELEDGGFEIDAPTAFLLNDGVFVVYSH